MPAPTSPDEIITVVGLAERYKVAKHVASQWTRLPGWPARVSRGTGRGFVWNVAEADSWVRENRPTVWAGVHQDHDNPLGLPPGDPDDLLTLEEAGKIQGEALRGKPLSPEAMRSLVHRKRFPEPDARDVDGARRHRWKRSTVYAHILNNAKTKRTPSPDTPTLAAVAKPEPQEPAKSVMPQVQFVEPPKPPQPSGELLIVAEIAEDYGVPKPTAYNWTKDAEFPQGVDTADGRAWDGGLVEAWVRRRRAKTWGAARGVDVMPALPEGDPDDLLDIVDFGRIWGEMNGRDPIPASTMYPYMSRGQIVEPDRRPGDGREPEVPAPRWRRATVYEFLRNRPGKGRFLASRQAQA